MGEGRLGKGEGLVVSSDLTRLNLTQVLPDDGDRQGEVVNMQ